MSRVVALLGVLAVGWLMQDQRPSFRAGVELAQLDVAVLDDQRMPVRGLTQADFTVFESGHPQPIKAFSVVALPAPVRSADAEWSRTVPADVATNAGSEQDGRLVVILMDRSINFGLGVVTARKIATAAVDALGPTDLAAVVSTSGGVPQNLTADRTRLIAAINQRDWSTDGGDPDYNPPFTLNSPLQDGRCLCGLCVLETITRVSDAVRWTPRRRKLLLFIGTGAVLQVGPQPAFGDVGCASRVRDAREKMLASLAVSNLTIHPIDTKGLVNIGPQTSTLIHGAQGGPDTAGPRQRLEMQQKDTNDILDLHGTLRVLAEQTGGRAVMDVNAPETKVPEILRESETYYLLAFERDPSARGDVPRPIEVKIGRKGLHVYAQRKYVSPPPDLPAGLPLQNSGDALTRALAGLLPNAGAPLALAVSPFALADDDEKASLNMVIDTGAFAQAATSVPLDIRVAAVSPDGREVAVAQQTSTIPPEPGSASVPPVVNVPAHLELAPGSYEVRAAVADASRARVASVFQAVSVPPFAQAPLSLSGIAIEIADQLGGDAAGESPLLPITQRTFAAADHVRAAFEVYQGTRRTAAILPVLVRLTITDVSGMTVDEASVTLNADSFQRRRARSRLSVPLERLQPGNYALRITARAGDQSVGRALRFTVH